MFQIIEKSLITGKEVIRGYFTSKESATRVMRSLQKNLSNNRMNYYHYLFIKDEKEDKKDEISDTEV